jgi:hypothetical protein
MLNVVTGELNKVWFDQFIDFFGHPKRRLVVWTVGKFKMEISGPHKDDRFWAHDRYSPGGNLVLGLGTWDFGFSTWL